MISLWLASLSQVGYFRDVSSTFPALCKVPCGILGYTFLRFNLTCGCQFELNRLKSHQHRQNNRRGATINIPTTLNMPTKTGFFRIYLDEKYVDGSVEV